MAHSKQKIEVSSHNFMRRTSYYCLFKRELPNILLSLIIGVVFTFYLCGTMITDPAQINLPNRDINMQFQAWTLFRNDSWHWPLGYTQNIIYPLGTYMVAPIILVTLKILSPILPKVFVYFGYLLIINTTLQFYIAFCIFRMLRNDKTLAFLGALFLLGASFFVWRFLAHIDLTAQWLILLAMLLVWKKPSPNYKTNFYYFIALLFFSIGYAHPYIPFMIYAIGIGQIFKLVYQKFTKFSLLPIIWLTFLLTFTFLAGYYFFSYFSMGNTTGTGFGQNQATLLSFFYPPFNSLFYTDWTLTSSFLYYESECYLGLGIILLVLAMLVIYPRVLIKNILQKQYIAFGVVIFAMFLYSLSNVILFTLHTPLLVIPMPNSDFIKNLCGTLQSSGRFSWPLAYLLIIGSIIIFYDFMNKYKKSAYIILSLLLALQVLDLSKLYTSIHEDYFVKDADISKWNDDLHDKFWYQLDGKYKHLIIIDGDYEKFSYLAALNNMTINIFYLSRFNQDILNLERQQINDFLNNRLESESIYIISKRAYDSRNILLNETQCKTIDSYIVCSTEWK